jgi:hypothetical protein
MYSFIGIYIILMEITCSQLDKLKYNLSSIKQDSDSSNCYQDMKEKLGACISHHQRIIG